MISTTQSEELALSAQLGTNLPYLFTFPNPQGLGNVKVTIEICRVLVMN
jgi:hypothetical protein